MYHCRMKLVQCNGYLFNTVVTDGLFYKHQGINNQSTEYAPMRFQLLIG